MRNSISWRHLGFAIRSQSCQSHKTSSSSVQFFKIIFIRVQIHRIRAKINDKFFLSLFQRLLQTPAEKKTATNSESPLERKSFRVISSRLHNEAILVMLRELRMIFGQRWRWRVNSSKSKSQNMLICDSWRIKFNILLSFHVFVVY